MKRKRLLTPITIRLDPDVKAAIEAMAAVQERRPSWIVRKALREWAAAQGKKKAPRGRSRAGAGRG